MAAYQMEYLLKHVLTEREKALPFMIKNVDWHSFEDDMKYFIDEIFKMMSWK